VKGINANANPFPNYLFHDFSQPLKDGISHAQPVPGRDPAAIAVILYKVLD
jgi:hypothetical protein